MINFVLSCFVYVCYLFDLFDLFLSIVSRGFYLGFFVHNYVQIYVHLP